MMRWNNAVSLIRMRAAADARDGITADASRAIRLEHLPRMSKYHYRTLCQSYEQAYSESQRVGGAA